MSGADVKTRIFGIESGHNIIVLLGTGQQDGKDPMGGEGHSRQTSLAVEDASRNHRPSQLSQPCDVNGIHPMTRFLYAHVRAALDINLIWNSRLLPISENAREEELQWWLTSAASFSGRPIQPPMSNMEIWTDASATGWGAACRDRVALGIWTEAEAKLTSNCREIPALLKRIGTFSDV